MSLPLVELNPGPLARKTLAMTALNRRLFLQAPTLLAPMLPAGLLLLPGTGYAQVASMADAIEKSETLFMLSQRAAKAYFAIGMNVRRPEAQKVLDASVQRFDRFLFELKAFAPTPAIKKTYADLSVAWVELKIELMGKTPSKAGAAQIVALNKAVFDLSGAGSNQLQVEAKTPVSKLQDTAGSVRMNSQRLSKNYFSKGWGVLADAAGAEVQSSTRSYLEGKAFLLGAPQTTAAIKDQIALANNQWTFIESAINNMKAPTPTNYTDVWVASENILSVMDSICIGYSKLA
jgi:hypothetical protein